MQHASTRSDSSHRQNKTFQDSVNYWRARDFPDDIAIKLARLRSEALSLVAPSATLGEDKPGRRSKRKPKVDAKVSSSNSAEMQIEVCPRPSEQSETSKSSLQENIRLAINKEITQEEIDHEIARQKNLGTMTEIPPVALLSSATSLDTIPNRTHESSMKPRIQPNKNSDESISVRGHRRYWIIAMMASTWLVHSMAQALGGGLWNYLIAAAFDFTPMILIGAKVNPDTQKIAGIGAASIFLIGLCLYLAPSVQTVFNEYSAYSEGSQRFALDMKEYNSERTNATSLIDSAKKTADASEKVFLDTKEKYGETSWRIASAKKTKEADFDEWKRLSEGASALQVPVAPKINNELRNAAQAIGMRIGLFAIVFLSMYVMRRLENEGSA